MEKTTFWSMMVIIFTVMVAGCAAHHTRHPVPVDHINSATLNGIPDSARTHWEMYRRADAVFQQDILQSVRDEPSGHFTRRDDGITEYHGLAISGGGAGGAFGAGILCGWSKSGRRPRFKIVTGISTGALIAPYAYLGPAYDEQLQKVYTTISSKDIFDIKKVIPIGGQSVAESNPLKNLIATSIDEKVLSDIATAHAKGQRLYIGTTELDTQRFVVWNMGAIASIGSPKALSLFRDIMLASASIPGLLPPVYIEVELDGHIYDEMHVDGGVINQVFLYEFLLDIGAAANQYDVGDSAGSIGSVYVIRNGIIGPVPKSTESKALKITQRSIDTMIKSAAINDLFRIYSTAKNDNIDFNYIGIPSDYVWKAEEAFDPEEMNTLFNIGYQKALQDEFWIKEPFAF